MSLFKDKYKTNSNRLKDWDFSSEAIYFLTIVSEKRECIFGHIENDKMILNTSGQIIKNELFKSVEIRDNWIFHNWVIMPNHIHLLVEIATTNPIETNPIETNAVETHEVETHDVETHCGASLPDKLSNKLTRKPNSISSFVAIFKSVTTKQIIDLRRDEQSRDAQRRDAQQCVSTDCADKLSVSKEKIWQSNYHDHVVRNNNSFEIIHQYISNNPRNWNNDSINSK